MFARHTRKAFTVNSALKMLGAIKNPKVVYRVTAIRAVLQKFNAINSPGNVHAGKVLKGKDVIHVIMDIMATRFVNHANVIMAERGMMFAIR